MTRRRACCSRPISRKNNYEVIVSHNGESFLAELHACTDQLSLVILDVMLPDTDGFALCKQVRSRSNVPIIMLTASSDETDRIVGLELGRRRLHRQAIQPA
jgi:two-component system OmpR family response regulator